MVMPLLIQLSMFLDHKNSEEEKKRDGDCETKKIGTYEDYSPAEHPI